MTDTADRPLIVGIGELLWDVFEDDRRPGGAPANFAFHANQLGARGTVYSRVGDDELGRGLIDYLRQQDVDTTLIQIDPEHPTGTATVEMASESSPGYRFNDDCAWDFLEATGETLEVMRQASAVCFGTLAQRSTRSREAVHACLDATGPDCLKVYDINIRKPWFGRDVIEPSLERANILKLNEEELDLLGILFEIAATDPRKTAHEIRARFGMDLICVTLGKDGCWLVDQTETITVQGTPANGGDPVGAGDSFTAAMITALLRKWPLAQIGQFANQVGGLVASQPGAMPDLKDPFSKLIQLYQRR